ncbi:MAG: extracellular solute-binding protein, partial [Spirochaetales bacterium]|nr:extracellular solute-binding protein [Spirochaetales bacterium]
QQNGLSYLTDQANGHDGDVTRVVFDREGTLATFLDEWRKVYASGAVANLTSDVTQQFVAGRTAMMVASTSSLSTLLEAIGGRFELGVGFLPRVKAAATGGVNVGGGAIFLLDNGSDPEKRESWEFLKFLMGKEAQLYWHEKTGYFPTNHLTYAMDEFKAHIAQNPLFEVAIEQLLASNPKVQSVWWPNSYQAYYEIQNGIREMLEQNLSTEETVEKLAATLNRFIDDYYKMNQP